MKETFSAKLTDYLNEETIGSFGKKKEKFLRYPPLSATARLSLPQIIRGRIQSEDKNKKRENYILIRVDANLDEIKNPITTRKYVFFIFN